MKTADSEVILHLPEWSDLAKTLVDFVHSLSEGQDSYEVLSMLSDRCVEILPVAASGILFLDQLGTLQVIAASNPSAHLLDLFQIQNQQGPCFECYRTGEAIVDRGAEGERRWPQYTALARSKGFTATYALPLKSRGSIFGALNLFAEKELSKERLLVAQILADAATLTQLQLDPVANLELVASKVTTTIEERNVVEEAIGMIAQRFSIGPDLARTRIKRASFKSDSSLITVAHAIVSRDNSQPSSDQFD